ncbi:hypothetical protein NDU88_005682, partial [Pleurodeles waltl]
YITSLLTRGSLPDILTPFYVDVPLEVNSFFEETCRPDYRGSDLSFGNICFTKTFSTFLHSTCNGLWGICSATTDS